MISTIAGISALSLTLAAAAAAPAMAGSEGLLGQLTSCAEVADRDARLACYEAAAAALKAAAARGDLVVVDRRQAEDVRRQAFGLNLSSLNLFDHAGKVEPLNRVTGALASAAQDGAGRWTFRLADGGAWTQVDGDLVLVRPRAGMAVEIKRGAVGGYFLGLDGHAGVRVRRVQ